MRLVDPMRTVILALLCSCGIQEVGGGWGIDLPGLAVVRECDTTRIAPPEPVEIELCSDLTDEDLEASLNANGYEGTVCWPTERHAGPCIYGCKPHSGCNAYGGCYCP